MAHLLIYMPALNEGQTIFEVLSSMPTKILGYSDVRLLVVNDGSTDNTEAEARRANSEVINHKKNCGLGVAFQTAVNYALKTKADVMVSIDADGQFDTNEIDMMVAPIITNKADFCIGNRFLADKPKNMPSIKYWGNQRVNKLLSFLSNETIHDASCGFRAYSKECLINLNLHGKFTYTHEVILDLLFKGFYMKQVPVKVAYFDGRKSRVASSLIGYGAKSLKIMLKSLRDYKPFYFFGMIALLFFIISALSGLFVFAHWIKTGYITPYKSIGITSLIMFLVSILFLVLALLADMLGRVRQNQEKLLSLFKSQIYEEK